MSIASATVEANGWVLAVRGQWTPSTFASFALDPDGVPAVVLTLAGVAGHTRSGGAAVAAVQDRGAAIVATRPLRQPAPPVGGSVSGAPVLDEVDHGDGTRTVRLALSDRVLAGETVSIAFGAGWRAGLSGAVVAASNGSARTAIAPIARWAVPHLMLTQGSTLVPVELIIASHYPRHFGGALHQAVAGVRIRATDGSSWTAWQWVTAPTLSPLFGDNLKCWRAVHDCAGLTAGVISVVAEIYPWVGAVKQMGTAHSTDPILASSPLPDQPLHVCYDPAGGRYQKRWVYVDPVAGSASAAAVTVATSLAGAKAGTRAIDPTVAFQAMYLANVPLPAANGFAGGTRSADWWEVVLAPGTHAGWSTAVTSGFGAKEGFLVVRGDPDDPDPVANCIWVSPAATPTNRNLRWHLRDLSVRYGQTAMLSTSANALLWTDRVNLASKAGQEANSSAWFSGTVDTTRTQIAMTRTFCRGSGASPTGNAWRGGLYRACDFGRTLRGHTIIGCVQHYDATLTYGTDGNVDAFMGVSVTGATDQLCWGCISWRNNGFFWGKPQTAPGTPPSSQRWAVVNGLAEGANVTVTGAAKPLKVGETEQIIWTDSLIEGFTAVGRRVSFHNDPPDNGTQNNGASGIVVRNSYFDRFTSKTDLFGSPPWGGRTGMWEIHWNVGWHGNVNAQRSSLGAEAFPWEYFGRGGFSPSPAPGSGSVAAANFVDDRCNWGPLGVPLGENGVGPGYGNYRPQAPSVLIGRGGPCSIDVDLGGALRAAAPATGAFEAVAGPVEPAVLGPVGARHAVSGAEPALARAPQVRPAANALAMRATATSLQLAEAPVPSAAPSARTLLVDGGERVIRPR